MKVDICVATFKRPALLADLLRSVIKQTAVDQINEVLVVDNDSAGSARATVDEIVAESGATKIRYISEPAQGISQARNAAIRASSTEALVFVDDDEVADEKWLEFLLEAKGRYNADVVFGAVQVIIPENAPLWILRGRFFESPVSETGTLRSVGATNNVLISRAIIDSANRLFDLSFGKTGGEDTEFFTFLACKGAKMIFCREAIVFDQAMKDRMNLRWLMRRHFRGGQTLCRVALRYGARSKVFASAIARAFYAVWLAVLAGLLCVVSRDWSARSFLESVKHAGFISVLVGGRFQEYR